mgnify:CR=1 FL=1
MKKKRYTKPKIEMICTKVFFLCNSNGTTLVIGSQAGDASQADSKGNGAAEFADREVGSW